MNRAETESRLTEALAELDAIYKKYDLAALLKQIKDCNK